MRKSPVREASCELEADAHVVSLLNKNRAEKMRHLVPDVAVPSLETLWEEEKRRKKNFCQTLSPEVHESIRNVSIGNGFVTRPALLSSSEKGTVLHR